MYFKSHIMILSPTVYTFESSFACVILSLGMFADY